MRFDFMGREVVLGMSRIGLIDVDGHNFPNLPLMKLSAYHKSIGDSVEWYEPLFHSMGEPFDKVYMSKVFSFTPDYQYYVNAQEVVRMDMKRAIHARKIRTITVM